MAESSWIRIKAVDAHLDARTVNDIIEKALSARAVSVTQRPELRQAIGRQFIEQVTKFVPKKSGDLRASGEATTDGRVYWTAVNKGFNYASTVYDQDGDLWPDGTYKKPTTAGTVPRWVEKVQPDTPDTAEWDAFVNNITPIIKEAFAHNE